MLQMLRLAVAVLCSLVFTGAAATAQAPTEQPSTGSRISSSIDVTDAGERILLNRFEVAAPIERVWWAYTTGEGWRGWAAPVAEVDLRAGGEIVTHYDPAAEIGDPGTNRLEIVNYVPRRVLTLQADLAENWPEIMKQEAHLLYNVILFEALDENSTRVESYGVGYGDSEQYDDLLGFFTKGNESLLEALVQLLESR